MPDEPEQKQRDAVCFTSGLKGMRFSAGVIHAYLAADRPPPAVVAGISSGAISAAALQKAYRMKGRVAAVKDGDKGDTEAARWAWFQRYAAALTLPPAEVFWDSLPNPTDFFADENLPGLRDFSLNDALQIHQMRARRQKYLLQHLGLWLSKLSIRLSTVSGLAVNYVRYKESYPAGPLRRLWNLSRFVAGIAIQLLLHTAWHPIAVQEGLFDDTNTGSRPLLGWYFYVIVWIALLALAAILLETLLLIIPGTRSAALIPLAICVVVAFGVVLSIGGWKLIARGIQFFRRAAPAVPVTPEEESATAKAFQFLKQSVLASVGFGRSLLHSFPLRARMSKLFRDELLNEDDLLSSHPMPALLVVAPLQTFYRGGEPVAARQLWAKPDSKIRTIDALIAAVAVPGIWEPHRVTADEFSQWEPLPVMKPPASAPQEPEAPARKGIAGVMQKIYSVVGIPKGAPPDARSPDSDEPGPGGKVLDFVDGAAVRQNPLPALLEFLRRNPVEAEELERGGKEAKIHVVYSVPLDRCAGDGTVGEESVNIVDTAFTALKLAARRDTRMEVEQLNCISKLERELLKAERSRLATAAFADEIAPPAESPATAGASATPARSPEQERFREMAVGCRRTLEKLYAGQIASLSEGNRPVACSTLLTSIATVRDIPKLLQPGLSEICGQCERQLQLSETVHPRNESTLYKRFPNLKVRQEGAGARPRIVFLWSGGVFRGSFHIGMIAALRAANIRPDMIAGASVGTLMGAALASIFSLPEDDGTALLQRLVYVFRNVDSEVALTKTLKEASRDLGIRGRHIRLSPGMVRQKVLQGIRADSGYAATGAPPELIDAIASFFSIPLDETREIAGRFIAGMVEDATGELLTSIRKHTLTRLNIQTAVLGSSLLELRAADLIGDKNLTGGPGIPLNTDQPFIAQQIAFLATTTNLGAQSQTVFGDDPRHLKRNYDFVAAALSSCAFPAIFAPRRESDVLPGHGRFNVRYSDGGIFDNLPFLPAIESLSRVQREETLNMNDDALHQYVVDRHDNPDLFLAGALDARSETAAGGDGPFDYFNAIASRATQLKNNGKIHSFVDAAHLGCRQLGELARVKPESSYEDRDFVRTYVNSAVLPVFPSDAEHLNPTFAFCRSTGMKPERLAGSIADGCFQTFQALAEAPGQGSDSVRQSLKRVYETRPSIKQVSARSAGIGNPGECPFFQLAERSFACPFTEIGEGDIHTACRKSRGVAA